MTGKPIFVPLAKEPFLKFERGTKSFEIRQLQSPVAKQVCRFDNNGGHPVVLSYGYSGRRLHGDLGTRYFTDHGLRGLTPETIRKADLGEQPDPRFFDPFRPIVAFEVRNLRLPSAPEGGAP